MDMNISNEDESQQSTFMDLSSEFNNNTEIMKTQIADRPPQKYGQVDNLRSISELPKKYQPIFSFPFFNIIQSTVIDDVLYTDEGIVVSAPTSSGKTVVFELAILRLLMKIEDTHYTGRYKIIYVAPVKSLCNERLSEWHSKFSQIGLSCIVVTGDSDIVNHSILDNYNIVITTPEKWDSLTRNVKDNDILKDVKLFMIDEVHLLNEETRGPILEEVVCRMKIFKKREQIRFIAVSSTIPNIEDIAEWLGTENHAAVHFKIDEHFRPVKLNKIVLGYPCKSGDGPFKFDLSLNYKLQSVIMQYAERKPTLIFCSTRKGVEMTATHISKVITFHLTPEQRQKLQQSAAGMLDSKMKMQLTNGVGCHHGGMTPENRSTIEHLFRSGCLPVLITTSTLAMGVNLPAHLVIVKSTEYYTPAGYQDYSESSLMQMIGRAGRPQFDTSATVVIMTKIWKKEKYERMLGGTELIESNLHRHLTEHLNAEVVLGIISDIAIALDWLRQTFLYIRVQKNPKHYNIPTNLTKAQIEKKLQDLCQIEINALNRHGMLQIDQTDGFSLYPTNMGKIMANYYLAFTTMKLFVEIKGNESLTDILNIITKSSEFSETCLRVNDKKTLNTLNRCKYQETIRFPLPGNIKTSAMKVNCIIQATFGSLRIQNPSLYQESQKIMKIGERLSNCLVEYILNKNNCFCALLSALILNQCFHAKLWENSAHVSKQLHKIGTVLSSMLVTAGKTSFKSILESNPRDIERIINRNPPMGNQIQEEVLHLPFYKIKVEPPEKTNMFKVKIVVTLLNPENIFPNCTAGLSSCMTLIVGDTENHVLCCKKIFHSIMAERKEHVQYVDVVSNVNHSIQAYLISENWVGLDCQDQVDIIINSSASNLSVNTLVNTKQVNNQQTPQRSVYKKTVNTPITQYFKASKNLPIKPVAKNIQSKKCNNTAIKNATKPIDSYFTKEKASQNLKLLPLPNTNNTNQNKENDSKQNQNLIPEDYYYYDDTNLNIEQCESSTGLSQSKSIMNNNQFNIKKIKNVNKVSSNTQIKKNYLLNSFDKFEQSLKKIQDSSNSSIATYNTKQILNQDECIEHHQNENLSNIQDNEENHIEQIDHFGKSLEQDTTNSGSVLNENEYRHFKNFSFFENDSTEQNNKNDLSNLQNITIFEKIKPNCGYDTEFYPSNLCDLFPSSQSQNYSQFSFVNNNTDCVSNKNDALDDIHYQLNNTNMDLQFHGKSMEVPQNMLQDSSSKQVQNNIKPSLGQYSNNFQAKTQTLLSGNKLESYKNKLIKPKLSKTKYSDKIVSHISSRNFLHSYQKSVEKKPTKAVEILSQFQYTPKKKFEHNSQKTLHEEHIFEPDIILDIDDDFDYNTETNKAIRNQNTNNLNNKKSENAVKRKFNIDNETQFNEKDNKNKNTVENVGSQKPTFPKSFREYVQQTINELKAETLVNEYYNYDIGFEEFLMAPLNSDYGDSENDEESQEVINTINLTTQASTQSKQGNIKMNQETNGKHEDRLLDEINTNTNNTQKSVSFQLNQPTTQIPLTNNESFDFDNITFLSPITLNKDLNENLNTTLASSHDSEESNMDLRVENKYRLIEKWIDSQVSNTQTQLNEGNQLPIDNEKNDVLPNKKPRLSSPMVYSKYSDSYKEMKETKKYDNIFQNDFFNSNRDMFPQNTNDNESGLESTDVVINNEKSNHSGILKISSYNQYFVENETKYNVTIYERQESYKTQMSEYNTENDIFRKKLSQKQTNKENNNRSLFYFEESSNEYTKHLFH